VGIVVGPRACGAVALEKPVKSTGRSARSPGAMSDSDRAANVTLST
jgi:hypothetical protein